MPVLKRVGIVSAAKITAVIGIVIGLIMGIIFGLVSTLFGSALDMMGGAGFGGFGLLAIVILPIVYGIGGFIYGAVVAVIYNIIARIIGGIVLEFEG